MIWHGKTVHFVYFQKGDIMMQKGKLLLVTLLICLLSLVSECFTKEKEEEIQKYTVIFNSNGGTTVAAIMNVTSGSIIEEPAEPTKEGYFFGGWYKEEMLISSWNFATDKIIENMMLYAKWYEKSNYEIKITGNDCEIINYSGSSKNIIIPEWIYEKRVINIEYSENVTNLVCFLQEQFTQ